MRGWTAWAQLTLLVSALGCFAPTASAWWSRCGSLYSHFDVRTDAIKRTGARTSSPSRTFTCEALR